MKATTDKTRPDPAAGSPWWRKLLWFVGLWLAGLAVITVVAYAIRWAIL